jgi:prepilin-type N-terminal cleavage/methylation domain-containing protein/prepilin-type processing-associated H-X9-DG protein
MKHFAVRASHSRKRDHHPTRTQPLTRRDGFTLTELLVVIGIIAVLAGLLFPLTRHFFRKAGAVQCVSNLKEIGVGVTLHASDHGGILPGPLLSQQSPLYSKSQATDIRWAGGKLVVYLAPYLETRPDWTRGEKSPLACPAWSKEVKSETSASYLLNQFVYVNGVYQSPAQATALPWGYASSSNTKSPGNIGLLAGVSSKIGGRNFSDSSTWMLKDADRGSISYDSALPAAPVHGNFRNALFYDLHVGQLDLSDNPR